MKKTICLILALAMMVCFAACGKQQPSKQTDEQLLATAKGAFSSVIYDVLSATLPDGAFTSMPNAYTYEYVVYNLLNYEIYPNEEGKVIHNTTGDYEYGWVSKEKLKKIYLDCFTLGEFSYNVNNDFFTETGDGYRFGYSDASDWMSVEITGVHQSALQTDNYFTLKVTDSTGEVAGTIASVKLYFTVSADSKFGMTVYGVEFEDVNDSFFYPSDPDVSPSPSPTETTLEVEIAQDTGTNYCIVKKAWTENGNNYVTVDYIQVIGHGADDLDENGEPYDNDWVEVKNTNTKLRTFIVSPGCTFLMVDPSKEMFTESDAKSVGWSFFAANATKKPNYSHDTPQYYQITTHIGVASSINEWYMYYIAG